METTILGLTIGVSTLGKIGAFVTLLLAPVTPSLLDRDSACPKFGRWGQY